MVNAIRGWWLPFAVVLTIVVIAGAMLRPPTIKDKEVIALAIVGDGPALERLIEEDPGRLSIGDPRTGTRLIHYMVRGGSRSAVRVAMEHDADPSMADRFGMNAFHHLLTGSQAGDSELAAILSLLVTKPEGISAADQSGMTPLHLAAQLGLSECTTILIGAGASHAAQDRDGNTPLHYAIQSRHVDVEKKLRAAGADANVRNKAGLTASSMASSPSLR